MERLIDLGFQNALNIIKVEENDLIGPNEIQIKTETDDDIKINFDEINNHENVINDNNIDIKVEDIKNELVETNNISNINLKPANTGFLEISNITCTFCFSTFPTISSLNKHIKDHKTEKYSCSYCPKSFKGPVTLKNHLTLHVAENLPCDFCDKTIPITNLISHQATVHADEKQFKCQECGLGFTEEYTLNIHLMSHVSEGQLRCILCNKTFAHKASFK